jgi:hypothetical protein
MNIIQLVPRLASQGGGIGDYSLRLAQQLLKDYGILTHFLTYAQANTEPSIECFSAAQLPKNNYKNLFLSFPGDTNGLIYHCDPTYSSRQLFWILEFLKEARKLGCLKLVIMFHELIVTSKWRGTNIFNPRKFWAVRNIAKLADKVLTNNSRFQSILQNWSQQSVICIPNFSTIGEPDLIPSLKERTRRMIVFGTTSRSRIYTKFARDLVASCHNLEIKEVYDIGKISEEIKIDKSSGINLVKLGFQPSESVRELMLNSLCAFFDYSDFPGQLAKSTIWAVYAAHGLVTISSRYNPSEADGIKVGKHYLTFDLLKDVDLAKLQTVADNARNWSENHSVKKTAKVFALQFNEDKSLSL